MNTLRQIAGWVLKPIRLNATFFTFMYVLGCVCSWVTIPHTRNAALYGNLYLELFLDVYILALVLTLVPRVVRPWLRSLLYVVLYATALADVYCFVKFDSTLTPTMLLLVGETDSREASEFIRACVSPDVLFSNVGWVLLVPILHILLTLELRFPHFVPRRVKTLWQKLKAWAEAHRKQYIMPVLAAITALVLAIAIGTSAHNKAAIWKLMTSKSIGEVEHTLTEPRHAELYLPIWRLAFSIYAAYRQPGAEVDTCCQPCAGRQLQVYLARDCAHHWRKL